MQDLSEKDRRTISEFIETTYGIKMPPSKKVLLQTRLLRRCSQLGYPSIHHYLDYLFTPLGQQVELDHFATIVSTHKTDFFRENEHFELLASHILPELLECNPGLGTTEPLLAWSAASSTGEEVYSIAMTIMEFLRTTRMMPIRFKVTGTDISDDIVAQAHRGIYPDEALKTIPLRYYQYIMRSKDPHRHAIRVVPELRKCTEFKRQNLMDKQYGIISGVHIIFCRNVLIYFNRITQESILHKLAGLLAPGGYLLIGHSESVSGMHIGLEQLRPTVLRRKMVAT